jgi:hypothetical protein
MAAAGEPHRVGRTKRKMAEKVHGILGYYDGILDGVADFMGRPHAFVIEGDLEADEPHYRLKALSASEFELFSEYWQMWRRWEDAFHGGEVRAGEPAVLPEDRPRHDEIEPRVKRALAVSADSGPCARGVFRPMASKNPERDGRWGGFEVVWTPE